MMVTPRPEAPDSVSGRLAGIDDAGFCGRSFQLGSIHPGLPANASGDVALAPLSGFHGGRLAPIWSRLGAAVYGHGERIYRFSGLRAFKCKFWPSWVPRYIGTSPGLSVPPRFARSGEAGRRVADPVRIRTDAEIISLNIQWLSDHI